MTTNTATAEVVVKDEPHLTPVGNVRYTLILLFWALIAFLGAQIVGPIIVTFLCMAVGIKSDRLTGVIENNTFAHFLLILAVD